MPLAQKNLLPRNHRSTLGADSFGMIFLPQQDKNVGQNKHSIKIAEFYGVHVSTVSRGIRDFEAENESQAK
jgi:hypothetical protein